jgi:hypothetical protein
MQSPPDDIWQMAGLLIEDHGAQAAFIASQKAHELLLLGDADQCEHWSRIANAIVTWEKAKLAGDMN